MTTQPKKCVRCVIYTRVSTEYGLEQDFNSLDAQRDAAEAYIRSQAHDGWTLIRTRYDDGGFSGGSTDRPALQQLLADIGDGKVDVIVVYKVDRLSRASIRRDGCGGNRSPGALQQAPRQHDDLACVSFTQACPSGG
jgi:DNA invertase Pin-like site-specific DNA recombinase